MTRSALTTPCRLAKQVVAQADLEEKLSGLAAAKAGVETELTEQKTVLVNAQTRNNVSPDSVK
jgi:hypothetical protein